MPQQHWLNANETGPLAPGVSKVMAAAVTSSLMAPTSRRRRELLAKARAAVASRFGLGAYDVVFTSGSEEADAHIVTEAVREFNVRTRMVAQVIISAADASAVAVCCDRLRDAGRAKVVRVPARPAGDPEGAGTVDPDAVQDAIGPDTCLISVEAVNPTTGGENDLRRIGAIARDATVPLHANVSLLAADECQVPELGLEAASLDFHRAGGPPGIGVLAIKRRFAECYGIRPYVPGRGAQGGLRGGPVAPHLLVGALESLRGAPPAPVAAAYKRAIAGAFDPKAVCDLGDYLASRRTRARARVVWLTGRRELQRDVVVLALVGVEGAGAAERLEKSGFWVRAPRDEELEGLDVPPRLYRGALSVAARGADPAAAPKFAEALRQLAPPPHRDGARDPRDADR